jgi:octaprenyl-diphosphate synthase
MDQIYQPVSTEFEAVNQAVIKQLYSNVPLVENIGQYIVDAGGKRLRPLLVLLSANACGYKGEQHIQLAAVIEFLHTATLLHDDVVDESSLRRGRLTANEQWGNAPSVLVGDFIYSRAFQLMVAMGNLRLMDILSTTTNTIAEGEVLQLTKAGDASTSEEEYMAIIRHKTAVLFAAAAQGGALLADAGAEFESSLYDFGLHTGIAFQLADDVLDYDGDPEKMGKNIGDDLSEGKPTLPLIYTMREGNEADASLVTQAITHKSADHIEAITRAVIGNGALEYTLERAKEHSQLAIDALSDLPPSAYKDSMLNLAEIAVSRTS